MSYFIWIETVSEKQAPPCRQVIYLQHFHRAGLAGVIVSERDTKEFIGLSGKRRKKEWICILSQGLCNRKQTAGQQQIRTRSSSLSLLQCSDTVQLCRQSLHSQRTAIGQECSMGRRPDTGTGKVFLSMSGVRAKFGTTTSFDASEWPSCDPTEKHKQSHVLKNRKHFVFAWYFITQSASYLLDV